MNITLTGTKIMQDTKFLAFEKNNGVDVINITVDTDESWSYKLDVKYPEKCCTGEELYNIIDLNRDGDICSVELTSKMLPFSGKYTMQLRAINGDKVKHSDTFDAWIKYSIEPGSTYNPVPSEFYQIEQNITEINNHPPYPDISGFWMIWNSQTNKYELSDIPTVTASDIGAIPVPTTAEVGQTIVVKAVDDTGKPTEWEPVTLPEQVQADWNETDTTSDAYIANKPTIPSKTSDLTNDSGFLTSIPEEYVTDTELISKGYLTSYTETDPTVPAWAKAETKPTYTAAEVGALPADTVIPSIDATLTQSGKAADAAVVGQKLGELSEEKVSLPKSEDGTAIPGTAGWYAVSDGAGGIKWVESAPSTGGGGETTTHGIAWNLVNVTSSNNAVSVADGASLVAVLTPADGYTLGDVTITMGGEVVTGAWNADTATIDIASVTGDVVISCAGVVAATEEVIAHTWSNGVWKYDTATETWAVNTATMTRCCIQQQIDATDGYLKIRFNRQNSYDQYMSDPATDCPMIEPIVANGIMNLATTKLRNLGNAALVEVPSNTWQKLEWNTDYYLPAGYIYRIQAVKNIKPVVLDEDSLAYTPYSATLYLGSSNANMKSIVTTDGFCMITKITGGSISTEASVASSVDAQYTQELGISTMSLVPDDVESEPTTYTGTMKKAISEWMIAYKGDTRKIPVIIHTDQHGRLSSASKPIFTALGNLVPWYDVSKIMNLGDCVGDHWEDADTENPFLSCGDLETMMECLADIPISKRLDVFGNHDTWYHDAGGNDVVVPDQARLSQYFRNIFARNSNSNQQGYFTVRDDYYNVKYVVISGFEYTTSRSTFRISTAQMAWAIEELGKDDGYDIVVVSHVPLYYQPSTEVYPTGMTPSDAGSTAVSRVSNVDTDALFNARKNKTSGTVTDSDGVEHNFDFSNCTTDILCSLHGHIHMDGYNYVGGSGLVNVTFDWFADNTMHFVLVDRVNRQLNVWKVDSTNTVQNYQVPLDKATE